MVEANSALAENFSITRSGPVHWLLVRLGQGRDERQLVVCRDLLAVLITWLWFSLDGNSWFGGRVTLNGVENFQTLREGSRIGLTASVPVGKHQSLKVGYSDGTYFRNGGNYQNVSVAWQYSWLRRPN